MREEPIDIPGPDEPVDGWQTAAPLIDSEIVEVVLCRFTGDRVSVDALCDTRQVGGHPDTECRAVYLQADNLPFITDNSMAFEYAQDEVRQPWHGGEWSGVRG